MKNKPKKVTGYFVGEIFCYNKLELIDAISWEISLSLLRRLDSKYISTEYREVWARDRINKLNSLTDKARHRVARLLMQCT